MKAAPKLILEKFQDLQSYKKYEIANTFLPYIKSSEDILVKDSNSSDGFQIEGYCFVCQKPSLFNVDYSYSRKVNGVEIPNWRERLVCSGCKLNNRMRAAIHFFELECFPSQGSKIYLTEQSTLLYKYLSQKFPRLIGSEFLGEHISGGDIAESGLRNEDLTNLSFQDGQFDCILSFDVFEHIPNYIKAFNECYRILKPAGKMLFTVPFRRDSQKHIIRALREPDGTITHLEEPEYHGDPISKEGCLCYQHFGWKMLDELRKVGFSKVEAVVYWSRFYGYLGNLQIAFICKKSASDMENKIDIEYSKNCQKNFKNAAMVVESEASYFSIANKLMREGKLEEAIAHYRRAIAQNPNFAWYHHNLAEALIKQGQFDEAIASYRRAIEIKPNFASFHHNLAQALVKQCELEEALIFFRKAIELNPNLVLAYRNLPANHSLLYQLGCIFLQQCSKDEAVTYFLKAIQVKSNFFPPYLKLRYMLPLNRLDEVIACCRKAIELQPDFAWADICLGYALTKQGKHDEAIRCFQSASYKQTRISYPSLAEKQCNSNLISKPNFIICGVAKCGTTSLSQYIFEHPQVIPAIQKEIHFFSYEYSQRLDWYLAQFPSIPEGESFLTGEASPSYLTYIGAEKRIFEHFPKVKLICLLRNPVNRTISAYYHCRQEGTENRSFEQAILSEIEALKGIEDSPVMDTEIAINRQEIRYLKSSMYFYFIKKWMERFSSEQFLIVKSEDFYANTAVIMQQVFNFLEIPSYQAAEYKKYTVGSYKPIGDNLRRQLSEFFLPYNQKLENYLGRKFNWK